MKTSTLKKIMLSENLSVVAGSIEDRLKAMDRVLWIVLTPQTLSDRTCHRRVIAWLTDKIDTHRFEPHEILSRCISYALEASGPSIRNPNALFMSLLKKELGYPK